MAKAKTIIVDGVNYIREDSISRATPIAEVNAFNGFIGKKLFIRTVTYHCTGLVTSVFDGFIELEDSAWIADSGRFADALATGELSEVEPTKRMWVAIASIVDIFEWEHDLPLEQK